VADGNRDTAGVVAPAPLIFAIPLLVALYEDRSHPLSAMPQRFATPIGGVLIGIALIVLLASAIRFWKARTPLVPYRPTTAIVETWPYSMSRNPIYLSMSLMYVGISLVFNTLWPLLLFPLVMLVMQRGVIEREERYLERKFGREYIKYKSRVRRWL